MRPEPVLPLIAEPGSALPAAAEVRPPGPSSMTLSQPYLLLEGDHIRWFNQLFSQASDAVFVVGPDFRVVWWGPRAEELLEVPTVSALGRRCFELVGGLHAAGQAACGPKCWVMRAARRGRSVPAFRLDVRMGRGDLRSYTAGFMCAGSGEFLIHVLRQRELSTLQGLVPIGKLQPTDASADGDRLASLSARERQVLLLIMAGVSSAEMARRLSISHATARNHVQNVLVKLGVHSRLEAAMVAAHAGVEPPPDIIAAP